MVEGARLESVYTPKGYLGFESLTLRQFSYKPHFQVNLSLPRGCAHFLNGGYFCIEDCHDELIFCHGW